MQRKNILVINPNSNRTVTAGLRESLAQFSDQANIECCTLENGPFGIESDEDIKSVIPLVVQKISELRIPFSFLILLEMFKSRI